MKGKAKSHIAYIFPGLFKTKNQCNQSNPEKDKIRSGQSPQQLCVFSSQLLSTSGPETHNRLCSRWQQLFCRPGA